MPQGFGAFARVRMFEAAVQVAASVLPLIVAWWLFVLDDDDRAGYLESVDARLDAIGERFARARELVPAGFVDAYAESPALAFARSRLAEMELAELGPAGEATCDS